MSREDLSRARNQTERIDPPPKPNGEHPPDQPTKEDAEELAKQRKSFAAEIAMLAVVKLRDDVGYPIQLRAVMKRTGFGKRDIERAVKPAYEALLAQETARLGDSSAPGQRDEVEAIGRACELFRDEDGVTYAIVTLDGHRETWPVSSKRFRRYLVNQYRHRHGRLAAGTALTEGIEGIAAIAANGAIREVFVRVGNTGEKIYLDLCRDDWKVVEIDAGGWRILDASPVPFLRPAALRSLPLPCRDALGIKRLRLLVNVADDDDWILLVSWLVGAFRPKGPYPILLFNGEQGSAKTWSMKVSRRCIDPVKVLAAKPHRSEDDLIIAAKKKWIAAFDNVSSIDERRADELCRLATGAGLENRELYSDDEVVSIDVCRPVMLNGIPDIAARGDFAERSIGLSAPVISEDARREEDELEPEFMAAAPAILGGLLDGVATALARRPAVRASLKKLPRMADFAVLAAAAAPAFGWTEDDFFRAYGRNSRTRVEQVVEADPVAEAVRRLVEERWSAGWEGPANRLLKELDEAVSDATLRQKRWPKGPAALSNRLRRAAPALRKLGIEIARKNSGDRNISIRKTAPGAPAAPERQ